ncbi:MAG TPA: DUF1330 domain-containing protein [Baekduia sp.]|nr:DUF1330 domain-containing protein [Baekduia sp.]
MPSPVDPTGADLKRFLAEDDDGPVTMLNLLRFKPDGGRDSYDAYATASGPFIKKVGGTIVYFGTTTTPLVAPPTDTPWDAVLLVCYPRRQAFSAMVAGPEYQQITHLRTQALDAAVLQPTITRG